MLLARHGGDVFGAARRLDVPISALLDFSASINPLGLSQRVSRRLKEELCLVCHYPDSRQAELRSLVASRENIDPDGILFGNGATQLLYLIPRHLNPQKSVTGPANLLRVRCRSSVFGLQDKGAPTESREAVSHRAEGITWEPGR